MVHLFHSMETWDWPKGVRQMKVAIVGAGAIGAYLGAKLAAGGEDVTLIARGPHLAAMHNQGVQIIEQEGDQAGIGDFVVHPSVTDDLEAGVRQAEVVFLTVKAHSVAPIAARLDAAMRPDATIVTAQNGIPWWYFQRFAGPLAGTSLHSVDPDGLLARTFAPERLVGSVVWVAATIARPGVVEHVEGRRFTLGELDGSESERGAAIAAALVRGGLQAPLSAQIRTDVWLKLLGNAVFNPLSALTHATLAQIVAHDDMRAVARAMMVEVESVAHHLGVTIPISIDRRLAGAGKVGDHKTSMLQDLENNRPMELEPLVGAVVELGDLLGVPLPHLRTVYACTRLLQTTLAHA